VSASIVSPSLEELEHMHEVYRRGGQERGMAINDDEASVLPRLPDDWHKNAMIL
jgi:hypothetical protein